MTQSGRWTKPTCSSKLVELSDTPGGHMRRREFITLLGGAVSLPIAARAQQTSAPKLGVLLVGNREPFSRLFLEGLRDVGYTEGQNIQIELRSAQGNLGQLPELAAELVRLKVDIIVASETPAVLAAKRAKLKYQLLWPHRGIRLAQD